MHLNLHATLYGSDQLMHGQRWRGTVKSEEEMKKEEEEKKRKEEEARAAAGDEYALHKLFFGGVCCVCHTCHADRRLIGHRTGHADRRLIGQPCGVLPGRLQDRSCPLEQDSNF